MDSALSTALSTLSEIQETTTLNLGDTVSTPTTGDYDYSDDLMCDRSSAHVFRKSYEPPLFWIIIVLGGVGNLAVVWVYISFRNRLKTMTDIYLLHLAVADLLFLGTLPLWAAEAVHGWSFGQALCKVNSALYKVNLFSSMLLLTCISVDRYQAIVQTTKAHNSKQQRLRFSKMLCVLVWMLALILVLPELIYSNTKADDAIQICRMVFPSHMGSQTKTAVLALQVVMGFVLPFVVMTFCYANIVLTLLKTRSFQKHKAMRVILVVVAVFVLSQLPYNIILVLEARWANQAANGTILQDCEETKRIDMAGEILKGLAYTHACLNPFVYAFIGVRFRNDIIKLLQKYHCWPSKGALRKKSDGSLPTSIMSDSEMTQALSL